MHFTFNELSYDCSSCLSGDEYGDEFTKITQNKSNQ